MTIRAAVVVRSGDHVDRAGMTTNGNIPKDGTGGAFGYGTITTDSIIVTTTHKGVLDSELQSNANDPVFHNHYVHLGSDATHCGSNPAVTTITFDSPGKVAVGGTAVALKDLPKSSEGLTQNSHVQNVDSFKLDPKFSGNTLVAVCVTDILPAQHFVVR